MRYEFDWDPTKAETNQRKHGVRFEDAMSVFGDPLALTTPDDSETEERWITLGMDGAGQLLLVVHTYAEVDESRARIRIVSSRKPTAREIRQYEEL